MTKRDELIALGGVGVKVKPLEWSIEDRHYIRIHNGRGLGLRYQAASKVYSSGWIVTLGEEVIYNYDEADEDAAKAAAQADYEQRIRSALIATPVAAGVRDILEKIACHHVTVAPLWWQIEARNALSLLSDDGGCICQNQHRRGYCTEPGCTYNLSDTTPSAPSVAVKAKALTWRDHRPDSFPEPAWSAETPFGFYRIEEVSASDSPAYVVRLHAHHFIADKDSLEEAKAAAQSDYEKRVRSCIPTTPEDDSVARVLSELRDRRLMNDVDDGLHEEIAESLIKAVRG